jgi:hypothetical protein
VEQGWSRGALAAVRALAARGWTVGVAAPDRRGLAGWSRRRTQTHLVRPVQPSADAFVESVAESVRADLGSYTLDYERLNLDAQRPV